MENNEVTFDATEEKKMRRAKRIDRIETIVLIVACAMVITSIFFIKPFQVSGESMDSTYHDGQRVFVNKMAYRDEEPKHGDVIVFKNEGDNLIKRVIGVEGDRVEVRDSKTYLNGKELKEPYVDSWQEDYYMKEQIVPEDAVFVMGDNRDVSYDSRSFGPIFKEQITGQVLEYQRTASRSNK